MNRPKPTGGLRHVALFVRDLDACERFYVDVLGMRVEWRPDPDNVYLTTGTDNLALHRLAQPAGFTGPQRLDHIGFVLSAPDEVDAWYEYLRRHGVPIRRPPTAHRDGARSLYCLDPDGNVVQLIHHPALAGAAP